MILRNAQIAIFDEAAEEAYLQRLADHLRSRAPASVQGLSTATLRRRILHGLAIAASYGFTDGEEQAAFVALMFRTAPNFHRHERLHRFLLEQWLAPKVRLEAMVELSSETDWAEVQEDYDEAAWGPGDVA